MNEMVECPACGGDGVMETCSEGGGECYEALCWRCEGSCEVTAEDAALSDEEVNAKYFGEDDAKAKAAG